MLLEMKIPLDNTRNACIIVIKMDITRGCNMNAMTCKTIAWRVLDGSECVGTVNYLERCEESHVLACVRHDWSNNRLTIERA